MSLQKYLQTIEGIDPGKIYVENVRSMLKLSRFTARLICEMAVKEKLFIKKIGLVCPNCNRILEEYNSFDEIPEEVYCHICDAEEKDNCTFKTDNLIKEEFYKLISADAKY